MKDTMFKHTMIALAAALACASASAANYYYIVVPVKGRAAAAPAPVPVAATLSAASLPGAVVGKPYAVNLVPYLVVTGDSAYTGAGVAWSTMAGALPAGLTLSPAGVISGTPSAVGPYMFPVQAHYKNAFANQSYQVIVNAGGLRILSATYGGNVSSTAAGNRTAFIGKTCNGADSCAFSGAILYSSGAGGDPFGAQAKDLVISYACSGTNMPTYTAPAEAGVGVHTLRCPG